MSIGSCIHPIALGKVFGIPPFQKGSAVPTNPSLAILAGGAPVIAIFCQKSIEKWVKIHQRYFEFLLIIDCNFSDNNCVQ